MREDRDGVGRVDRNRPEADTEHERHDERGDPPPASTNGRPRTPAARPRARPAGVSDSPRVAMALRNPGPGTSETLASGVEGGARFGRSHRSAYPSLEGSSIEPWGRRPDLRPRRATTVAGLCRIRTGFATTRRSVVGRNVARTSARSALAHCGRAWHPRPPPARRPPRPDRRRGPGASRSPKTRP